MRPPSDKILKYLEWALFGLAMFFMLNALAIPVKGIIELKTAATHQQEKARVQPVYGQRYKPSMRTNVTGV
jgi:hypothetical protein